MSLFSFFKNDKPSQDKVNWIPLVDLSQLAVILENAKQKPQVLFKHSTRCSISTMALSRFEREGLGLNDLADLYYLDLIANRPISNEIAELTGVVHQSPQVIVLVGDEVVYQASHAEISALEIIEILK